VFHAQKADRQGNVSCGYEAEIVARGAPARSSLRTSVDGDREGCDGRPSRAHVDAVAHARFGAHPAGCAGVYGPDNAHMAQYVAASQDDALFDDYLRTYVLGVKDHDEYVDCFVPRNWRQPARAAGG
jgi:glutaconate CoA-transferase subunit A